MNLAQANALNRRYLETGFDLQFQQALEWLRKAIQDDELSVGSQLYSTYHDQRVEWPLVLHLPPSHVYVETILYLRYPADVDLILRHLPKTVSRLMIEFGEAEKLIKLDPLQRLIRCPQFTELQMPPRKGVHLFASVNLEPFPNILGLIGTPSMLLDGVARLFPNLQHVPRLKEATEYARVFQTMRHVKHVPPGIFLVAYQ